MKIWIATIFIGIAFIIVSVVWAFLLDRDPAAAQTALLSLAVSFLLAERFFGNRYD